MSCAQSIGTAGGCQPCCPSTSAGAMRGVWVVNYPLTVPGLLVPQLSAFAAYINAINMDTIALVPGSQVGINPGEFWILDYSTGHWSLYGSGWNINPLSPVAQYVSSILASNITPPYSIGGYVWQMKATTLSCWSIYEEVDYATGPNAPYTYEECWGLGGVNQTFNFLITPAMYSHADDTYPSVGASSVFYTNPQQYIGSVFCPSPPNVNP